MKSRAQIKGHPLHPILVSFPIAFFIGTLLFDVLGFLNDRPDFGGIAFYLEILGVAFALLAAVPGLIDYFFTVPPASSAKKRAKRHGFTNTAMVVIFTITWFYRQRLDASMYIIIAAEVVGVILLFIAGWMGGTLVYRNQIGVDPRYANAGKWKELYTEGSGGPVEVADSNELQLNQMKLIHINYKRIVLARTESGYVAFDDHCTHKGGSLAGGSMMCGTVQCPWHGSQFDVRNGQVKAGPATQGISVYGVSESNGKVFLNSY
jgi:uncharacterized membrane protein/nitrite reductase/ring-hydroxylating ferredoxin subunit